jgi:hypothetical protein
VRIGSILICRRESMSPKAQAPPMSPLMRDPFDFIWDKSVGFARPKWVPLTSGNFSPSPSPSPSLLFFISATHRRALTYIRLRDRRRSAEGLIRSRSRWFAGHDFSDTAATGSVSITFSSAAPRFAPWVCWNVPAGYKTVSQAVDKLQTNLGEGPQSVACCLHQGTEDVRLCYVKIAPISCSGRPPVLAQVALGGTALSAGA